MYKKVPGELSLLPKSQIDEKINLNNQTLPQLQEIYERESQILKKSAFINKLPDKGEKIKGFVSKVQQAIDSKQQELQTCEMLNKLNLNKSEVENIEWSTNSKAKKQTFLDSDDDSEPEDVLNILSQNTKQSMIVREEIEEKSLVTEQDLLDIRDLSDPKHIKYILEITEKNPNKKIERQFKPYKTTINDTLDPSKEKHRAHGTKWEITAATPPASLHGPVKQLTIEESLRLQNEQQEHMKKIQAEHAVERLFERSGFHVGDLPLDLGKYREPHDDIDSNFSDEEHFQSAGDQSLEAEPFN